jgi:hypothetical protein
LLMGASLSDPIHDPWPTSASMLAELDMDEDGKPGVTCVYANSGGEVYPPVSVMMTDWRAHDTYAASRFVFALHETVVGCDLRQICSIAMCRSGQPARRPTRWSGWWTPEPARTFVPRCRSARSTRGIARQRWLVDARPSCNRCPDGTFSTEDNAKSRNAWSAWPGAQSPAGR